MSDLNTGIQSPLEPTVQAVTEPEVTQSEPTETEKALQAKIEVLEQEKKRAVNNQSVSDKKATALQKEKEELEKAGMSKTQLAEAKALEDSKFLIGQTKDLIVETMGLDEETAKLLTGSSGIEIKEKADRLKSYKEKVTKELTDKIALLENEITTLKGNTTDPGGGNIDNMPQGDLKARYDKAMNEKKGQLAFNLREQMLNEKKQ